MQQFDRSRFDHVGIVTDERQPGESWVEATRVWVTSPRAHPYNVEFLRYEPDSPVTGPVRTQPHVAYRVADLAAAIEGANVVLGPFEVAGGFLNVAFVLEAGALVEFMQYRDPDETGWF
ncbi:MAG: hypothetical protein IT201_03615 [Thermoleophilia bacterium]|nr:hypothetical protein [Thermoleophilia bacterium]